MKILVISANSLPAAPSGPAYIAGAALVADHTVQVFEALFAQDLAGELETEIRKFDPDVVALSIRLVHSYVIDEGAEYGTRHLDLRPKVKEIVDCVRSNSDAHIVPGGPGFNYYGPDWLKYLELDYGIRGEAELSFPLYLSQLGEGKNTHDVPGCIYRQNGHYIKVPRSFVYNLDETAFPAYELFDLDKYSELGINPAIVTKRGCEFNCTYCPYSKLEGKQYRLKSPGRVVDEIEHIFRCSHTGMVTFCDNNFNVPNSHAVAICQEIIDRKLDIKWGTGTIKPLQVTDEVLRLFKESGCKYLNLSVESASAKMLENMQRGSTVQDTKDALTCLRHSDIPFSVSLMIGAPGETPGTIHESLAVIDEFEIPGGVWVTIGISLWTDHQQVLKDARRDGQLANKADLFSGASYVSVFLSKEFMVEVYGSLTQRENYTVQVNKLHADYKRDSF